MRVLWGVLTMIAAYQPTDVYACSITFPPIKDAAQRIVRDGVLIRGHVVQAFDRKKHQSEITRADDVFIGNIGTKNFVIYHPETDFITP